MYLTQSLKCKFLFFFLTQVTPCSLFWGLHRCHEDIFPKWAKWAIVNIDQFCESSIISKKNLQNDTLKHNHTKFKEHFFEQNSCLRKILHLSLHMNHNFPTTSNFQHQMLRKPRCAKASHASATRFVLV